MKKLINLSCALLFVAIAVDVNAQYYGALSTTWNNPISASSSMLIQGAINRKMLEQSIANQGQTTGSRTTGTAATQIAPNSVDYSSLLFKPVANTGVAKQIADVIGRDPKERAALLGTFQEIQRSYAAEAAKGGKANNIAAALTFFLAAGSMAYHQTAEPSEDVTDRLVEVLQQELGAAPEFKSMTNLQKQQMHDWFVVIGGFVLAGYMDAIKTNDSKELADYKELADASFKIVFGVGAEKFDLSKIG